MEACSPFDLFYNRVKSKPCGQYYKNIKNGFLAVLSLQTLTVLFYCGMYVWSIYHICKKHTISIALYINDKCAVSSTENMYLVPYFLLNHCNIYHDKDEAMLSIFNNSMGLVTIFLVYKLTISVCPKCHATIIPEFLNH